jgi:hypothetical protein
MIPQAQLALPQQQVFPIEIPSLGMSIGMLGNAAIQIPTASANFADVSARNGRFVAQVQASFRLSLLKRQKFRTQGREERIATSMAALNAMQPTALSLAQWKEIVEEIEDED